MKKLLALTLAAMMLLGCASIADADEAFTYPMQFDGTITYFLPLNSNVAASAAEMSDTPFAQYLYEATGIKVEWQHPTVGSEAEGFNLMLASGDLADIIEVNWADSAYYPAGLDSAISNGLVLALNDYAELCPNYMATLESNEVWRRMSTTDSGYYPGFNFIRGEPFLQVYAGMIIRQDWLDKLGMEVPTTIDGWTEMLTRFRDELNATTPLIANGEIPGMLTVDAFCGAYGVSNSFYIDEGKVKYGKMEEGWKQTLELLAGWYADGLLSGDFITDTSTEVNAHVLNGDGGAFYGLTGSGIGVYMNSAAQAGDTEFNLVGAPYPVLNEGDTPEFGHYDNPVPGTIATVDPKSENIEAAIRLLDFGYSDAGYMLFNFGKEGESYTMVDDYPTYTDIVLNPEGGISMGNAIARVARSSYGGPFVQARPYMDQYLQRENQRLAVSTWANTNAAAHKLPPISVSETDSKEYNKIISEIDTFAKEYTALAISGEYDLANFQAEFVDVLIDIGIERAIEIQQTAYDAYMNR